MTKFYYANEIVVPEDIIPYLAKQELHWKKKHSAFELAYSWVLSEDIPASVQRIFETCSDFQRAQLVEAFFERDVDLRSEGRRSQTDLMAYVALPTGYAVIAVEGKVEEPFGPLVSEWQDGSAGKELRFKKLCDCLGLNSGKVTSLRYQLFHRSVSAIYEAQRYRCDKAMMLVHSFSPTQTSFADFVEFTRVVGIPVTKPNSVSDEKLCDGVRLRFAWCADSFYGGATS